MSFGGWVLCLLDSFENREHHAGARGSPRSRVRARRAYPRPRAVCVSSSRQVSRSRARLTPHGRTRSKAVSIAFCAIPYLANTPCFYNRAHLAPPPPLTNLTVKTTLATWKLSPIRPLGSQARDGSAAASVRGAPPGGEPEAGASSIMRAFLPSASRR